ncbi:hypothetical protein B7R21_09030 [Subtercola boreus]|uniref:Aldehyde dehydrogenase domain-containing protein n=2 Tax=Subtercola boreus TaxID=120213 RepID=A0A3E0VTM4_9MICO|nr:hypothetical protein B7R21_09030 [Subtercola boreus]
MWRQTSASHLKATFRRIASLLLTNLHGDTAAAEFESFAHTSTELGESSTAVILGQLVISTPRPVGTALIVSAPSCDPRTVVENVAAALAARNCVELALFEQPEPALAAMIEALRQALPTGVFRVLSEQTGWGGRGPETAIVILTPDHSFLNDQPWVRSDATSNRRALISFYSRFENVPVLL